MSTYHRMFVLCISVLACTPLILAGPTRRDLDTSNTGHDQTTLSRKRRASHWRHRRNIAFQVVRSKPFEASRLDVLKFDQEETNIGNHYKRHTGEFTAPVRGTYVFNLQVVASTGTNVEVSIQKTLSASQYSPYVDVVKAVSDKMGTDKTSGGQGTAVAVLWLLPGQKVTTSVTWIAGKEVIKGGSKTSFSGYLLR